MTPKGYALAAAVLFLAEVAFAVIHRAVGGHYFGFTRAYSVVIDWLLAAIWSASAVAALVRRPKNALSLMVLGASASLFHGLLFNISASNRGMHGLGLPFLVAGGLQLFCVAQAAPAFSDEPRRARSGRQGWPRWLRGIKLLPLRRPRAAAHG